LNPFGELDSDTAVSLARPFGLAVNKVARWQPGQRVAASEPAAARLAPSPDVNDRSPSSPDSPVTARRGRRPAGALGDSSAAKCSNCIGLTRSGPGPDHRDTRNNIAYCAKLLADKSRKDYEAPSGLI
jgi:hypothetical protein